MLTDALFAKVACIVNRNFGVEPRLEYGLKAGAARRRAGGGASGTAEARIGNTAAAPGAAVEKGAAVPLSEFKRTLGVWSGLEFDSRWLLGDYFPWPRVEHTLVSSINLLK